MKRKQDAYTATISDDTLLLRGCVTYHDHPQYGNGGEGMLFGATIKIVTDGHKQASHDEISLSDASYVILYAAFATNYNVDIFDIDETVDYRAKNCQCIENALRCSYDEIKLAHISDHSKWFSTVSLDVCVPDCADIPTDERLRLLREEGKSDPALALLYYNFGRYLLIESSGKRATLPANLQGIWSHDFRPAWGADYHTNINIQMNYWPAENANCSKTVRPLTHFVKMLSKFGHRTAKELFGCDGWTVNHTTDIFGRTGIHDSVGCGFFPMGGPWLCLSLWEHYEFTGDIEYLNEIYPILRGSCEFVCGYLSEDTNKTLVTSPSNSPENSFYYDHPDGTRKSSQLTRGATFDNEIIYALFTRMIYACKTLDKDRVLVETLVQTLERLAPLRVSERYKTVCEWIADYEECEPGHRHISHLFGLYPSDQINETDPEIYEAAKNTIHRRLTYGGGQTGWSRAWIINFFARLKDGNRAFENLSELLAKNTADNLFDLHPPHIFQIDGNLGATAGVTEMLIQSHLGTPGDRIIELLPALPDAWSSGCVKGLRARGGFIFEIVWNDKKLSDVTIKADIDAKLRLKLPEGVDLPRSSAEYTVQDGILECGFSVGDSVRLHF